MWCPTPKPKVTTRPKPVFSHKCQRRKTPESESNDNAVGNEKEKQHDPHRDRRYYGVKHTDITRMLMVEDRTCHLEGDQPHGLKKTDVTQYLERVVPSHACSPPSTYNGQSQQSPRNNNSNIVQPQHHKKDTLGDTRRVHPARPPSRCETRESRPKREASRENIRPETAPTGEMKRLSVKNSSTGNFQNKSASASPNRRGITSSPLKPIQAAKMASPMNASKPQTAQTTSEPVPVLRGSENGLEDPTPGFSPGGPGSGSMPASSHVSAGRLQPVPE